jgi:hypothetical protein
MLFGMTIWTHHFQIVQSIISRIPILVMDMENLDLIESAALTYAATLFNYSEF